MEGRLADAKNRFSEFVARALSEGPQRVRRHKDALVVVAELFPAAAIFSAKALSSCSSLLAWEQFVARLHAVLVSSKVN